MIRTEGLETYHDYSYPGTIVIVAVFLVIGTYMVNNFGGIRMKTLMYIDSLSKYKINNEDDPENKNLMSQLRNYDYGLMTQHLQYKASKKIHPVLMNNGEKISEGFQEASKSSTFKKHELFQRQISNRSIAGNGTLSANDTDMSAKDEEQRPSIEKLQASADGAFYANMIGAILFTGSLYGIFGLLAKEINLLIGTIILYPLATLACFVLVFFDWGIISLSGFFGFIVNLVGYIIGTIVKVVAGLTILVCTYIVYVYYASVKYAIPID